jgi:hypothetical protein
VWFDVHCSELGVRISDLNTGQLISSCFNRGHYGDRTGSGRQMRWGRMAVAVGSLERLKLIHTVQWTVALGSVAPRKAKATLLSCGDPRRRLAASCRMGTPPAYLHCLFAGNLTWAPATSTRELPHAVTKKKRIASCLHSRSREIFGLFRGSSCNATIRYCRWIWWRRLTWELHAVHVVAFSLARIRASCIPTWNDAGSTKFCDTVLPPPQHPL